jgi:ATP/maltotriose-dependent transcriptional regulator MalT
MLGVAWHNLGLVLGCLGAIEEARAVEAKAISLFAAHGNPRWEGSSRGYLARILLLAGEHEEAEAEARRAVELLQPAKANQVLARSILALVLLARRRPAEALAEAREAMELLALLGKVEEGEALARLMVAEALSATGDAEAARAAIADARDRLVATAARIDDPRLRDSFLHNVSENARTLELARAWLGEGDR